MTIFVIAIMILKKKSWLKFVLPEPNVTLEDNVDLLLVFRLHGEEKSIEAILKG